MINVHAFDFDGTITRCDSLIAFIRYAAGDVRTVMGIALYSPLIVLMKLHLYSNGRCKERLFSHFFKGMKLCEFDRICHGFASLHDDIIRPKAMNHIRQLLMRGDRVIVVSASIDNWVTPFFAPTEHETGCSVTVAGTRVEVKGDVLTGRFATPNCYGEEKVRRLEALLPDRKDVSLTAYGDSRGDKEMFEYADQRYFKPFE